MTWNYRIVKDPQGWGLFEVYYDNDIPTSSLMNPEFGFFDTRKELLAALDHMVAGTYEPDLEYSEDKNRFTEL